MFAGPRVVQAVQPGRLPARRPGCRHASTHARHVERLGSTYTIMVRRTLFWLSVLVISYIAGARLPYGPVYEGRSGNSQNRDEIGTNFRDEGEIASSRIGH